MLVFLAVARSLHFAAAISLLGGFAFVCFVAPRAADERLSRQLRWLAWASLVVALLSGAGWLVGVAAQMSGQPLGAALAQGAIETVLTRTRFGEDSLLRLALAGLLAVSFIAGRAMPRAARAAEWTGLLLASALLAGLAWAGHGAATPGIAGNLHLAGDIVHLLASGFWLGAMPPLAVLLIAARRAQTASAPALAGAATRRYSALAIGSVAVLLAGGLVNTWFLAGTVPALIGTLYGRLVLIKIALFFAMLCVAAANLLRLGRRLRGGESSALVRTIGQLSRNVLIETGLGLGAVAVAGVLGLLPPGLHAEPDWPLPFRLDAAELSIAEQIIAAAAAALFCAGAIAAVALAAAGRYRPVAALIGALVLCMAVLWLALAPAIGPATPTSFYASARPYDVASVTAGARVYAGNCAQCHGAGGHGDGAAAARLAVRPADLVAPHLFGHPEGDLYWWVSHGRGNGAMPGFADMLTPAQRWDAINFIRARAAGELSRKIGAAIEMAPAYKVPDFAFETGTGQHTLQETLRGGPALLVLAASPNTEARLRELAAAQPRLAGKARLIAVSLVAGAEAGVAPRAAVSEEVGQVLALFRNTQDGGETDLLLDRAGNIRARWTAASGQVPEPETLAAAAARLGRLPAATTTHVHHAE